MGSWAGEVHPTQLERQRICQLPGDWVVLGDGVLVDDKGMLTIVPECGNRCVGQSATLDRALATEMLQCLVKGGLECLFQSCPALVTLPAADPGTPGLGPVSGVSW